MIYLVGGSDFKKAQAKFGQYLAIFKAKQPTAEVFNFRSEDFNPAAWEEVIASQTLFAAKHIVLARRLSESEPAKQAVERFLAEAAASPHAFLFYETGEDEKFFKLLAGAARETKLFNQTLKPNESFNLFSLCDALSARDRRRLWLLYQEALRSGVSASDVFWKLAWQLKNMIIVAAAKNLKETNLKPFVASRALAASRHYSPAETKELLNNLTELLAKTFPESEEFSLGLEKFILNV